MSSENIYRHIPKISCLLCKSEVAINQFDRHHGTKQCLSGGKFTIEYLDSCRYCKVPKLSFDSGRKFAAHVKWCQLNPNRGKGIIDNPNMIGCNHMHTPEVIEKRRKRISEAHKRGAYKEGYIKSGQTRTGKKASDEAKRNISIAAQNSPHQRVCKRSHKFIDKRGREFIFDSSWEDILAIRLDWIGFS